ncbi:FlgO family outer membrane protein [Pseudoalteromonas phenolica]|uniref:FlgO family outer membrane protein n=1 Tax=Pseudoalteromonas phenolica TaxID=161398 RepID=UPI00384BCCD9
MKPITTFILSLPVLLLSGCSLLMGQPAMSQSVVVVNDQSMMIDEMVAKSETTVEVEDDMQPSKPDYVPMNHFVKLDNYVEQMAIELSDLLSETQNMSTELAVASFVRLDGTLQTSDQLGNQLAETFMHQLHRFGYQVVDTKLLDNVHITRMGDYVFSRKSKSRFNSEAAEYVLSGTMLYREKGVLVNARVMSLESKKVVATTSKMIPWYVLRSENILVSSSY